MACGRLECAKCRDRRGRGRGRGRAACLELLQACALVHDDVVDRYDTPREAGRIRRAGRLARRAGQRRRYGEGTVHTASTPLHRGFCCYLFDEDWQFLLIRRAASKSVFPVCGPTVSAAIPDLGRATWLRCVAGPGTSSASTSKGCASPWRTFGTALSTTVGWRTRSARCTSAGPASSRTDVAGPAPACRAGHGGGGDATQPAGPPAARHDRRRRCDRGRAVCCPVRPTPLRRPMTAQWRRCGR